VISLAIFFGMLGFRSIVKGLKFMGIDHWEIKTPLPTSYIAYAVRTS
jgi:hypothetical protein